VTGRNGTRRAGNDAPPQAVIPTTDEDRVNEVLDEDECRRLLEKTTVGRLACTDAALPVIIPLSYSVHDGSVVVRARRGSPVTRALRGAVVAFGVDAWDGPTRTGWSVNVVGPARVATRAEEVARYDALSATDAPTSPERCYLVVRVELIRGWRLSRLSPDGMDAGDL
jgi:hypothetical protein